ATRSVADRDSFEFDHFAGLFRGELDPFDLSNKFRSRSGRLFHCMSSLIEVCTCNGGAIGNGGSIGDGEAIRSTRPRVESGVMLLTLRGLAGTHPVSSRAQTVM